MDFESSWKEKEAFMTGVAQALVTEALKYEPDLMYEVIGCRVREVLAYRWRCHPDLWIVPSEDPKYAGEYYPLHIGIDLFVERERAQKLADGIRMTPKDRDAYIAEVAKNLPPERRIATNGESGGVHTQERSGARGDAARDAASTDSGVVPQGTP